MSDEHRFPLSAKLDAVDDAPEPFARALRDELPADKPIRLLRHAPALSTAEVWSPTTMLAVTEDGWRVAFEHEGGDVSVDKCGFTDTRFLELTSSLRWGRLRIDYAAVGTSHAATIQFNTPAEEPYREAIRCVLDGITPARVRAEAQGACDPTAMAELSSGATHGKS